MSDHIQQTIADLQNQLRADEQKVLEGKRLINKLAAMAGLSPMYSDAELSAGPSLNLSIRSDQFYGQPLATCLREILEMRKALNQGPATINEFYATLLEGGYGFETKNEDNAKRGLRISITKNTAIFHKLPNGKFGLREWYPSAKLPKAPKGQSDSDADDAESDDNGGGQ